MNNINTLWARVCEALDPIPRSVTGENRTAFHTISTGGPTGLLFEPVPLDGCSMLAAIEAAARRPDIAAIEETTFVGYQGEISHGVRVLKTCGIPDWVYASNKAEAVMCALAEALGVED